MSSFTPEIYKWFLENKRDLPWRKTANPYKIWISEIILQQTRVIQGTKYYERFIESFPNVFKLAAASEDDVLKLWQGLGYYSRARNLHYTSKYIVNNFNGEFPRDFNTILSLKGIGEYTASAIASIAFNLPYAAVDGNIQRVISRYYGIHTPIDSNTGKKEIQAIANELIMTKDAGLHNQAMMEFGALQCTPKSPNCAHCPVMEGCYAKSNMLTDRLPFKSKKIKQSIRYFYYYIIESKDFLLLEKRKNKDIWKNLYQFPLFESKKKLTDMEIINVQTPLNGCKTNIKSLSSVIKHILTHQTIYARFIHIEAENNKMDDSEFLRVNKKDIYKFAVPKLLEQYLKKIDLIE